jgi:ssDNA-binding Zn-finger/Zn-ribbon topoisomerase 1
MAEEKKRSQGQRGAIAKTICPKCGEYLQSCYIRGSKEENRNMKRTGVCCPSPSCDYILKDFVELEDTEELE